MALDDVYAQPDRRPFPCWITNPWLSADADADLQRKGRFFSVLAAASATRHIRPPVGALALDRQTGSRAAIG